MTAQNKVYVGNLPYNATDEELKSFFGACGEIVDAIIIKDRDTGLSKGFGFVGFASPEGSEAALGMNGQEMSGRSLRISKANEPSPRPQRGGGGGRGGFGGGGRGHGGGGHGGGGRGGW
ncbi:MAG: RNA-binding protein [Candidatus Dependentiae bacterium]|jgi:RNA recognition motif-containing protein